MAICILVTYQTLIKITSKRISIVIKQLIKIKTKTNELKDELISTIYMVSFNALFTLKTLYLYI